MKKYLAIGVLTLFALGVATFAMRWANAKRSSTDLKPAELEMYTYASSCPTKQSLRFDGDGFGQRLVVALHECDATVKNAPKWLSDGLPFDSQQSFVIAERQDWLGKRIVAGHHSDNGYAEVEPARLGNENALLLVTNPAGSGAIVDWCLFAALGGKIGCIPYADDFDQQASKYLQKGEFPANWFPQLATSESGIVLHFSSV